MNVATITINIYAINTAYMIIQTVIYSVYKALN